MLNRLAIASFVATGALAQIALPSEIAGLTFSPECQQAVIGLFTGGDFASCFPASTLLPILTSNDSVIPVLDDFMSELCYTQPCSSETLDAAAQAVIAGCSNDLSGEGLDDNVVTTAFSAYPLVREILCTKTSDPYTEESYGGFLGAPPIEITPENYNSTDGYFCVTSVLTQLSAYFGDDLTVPYVVSIATGANQTAQDLATSIEANFICNDCIFAAAALIEEAYPEAGSIPFDVIFGALNMTSPLPAGTTINEFANDTCAYEDRSVSTDGTLPESVTVSIVNSTFTA